MSTENATPATTGKIKLTIAMLAKDQADGLNRKAIAAKYGAPVSVINKLFKHPDLAKLRPKHASNFELVDDSGATYSPGQLAMADDKRKAEEKAAKAAAGETEATETAPEAGTTEAPVTEQAGI